MVLIERLSKSLAHKTVCSLGLVLAVGLRFIDDLFRKFWIMVRVHRRRDVIALFGESVGKVRPRTKLCIVIAHIVGDEESGEQISPGPKVERLRQTMDGILMSFADCELTIIASSLPGRSIVRFLPEYQRAFINLIEAPECDPFNVEFRIQDELISRADNHEWFMFLEDDIVIHDGTFLSKIQHFHENAGPRDLLIPHRYEYVDGVKRYIDLLADPELAWSRLSALDIEGVRFSEFTNPHGALYCLSTEQLRLWEDTGRTWRNRVVSVGPLESAATFCLLECFHLFKPHPSNAAYLEVRHFDTKYSRQYPSRESQFRFEAEKIGGNMLSPDSLA